MNHSPVSLMAALAISFLLSGCVPSNQKLLDGNGQSQLEMRTIQGRQFETADKAKTLRTVIATLQDLEFVVDKADLELGVISATKLKGYSLKMTVSVMPRGETHLIVRANAQYNIQPITEPEIYRGFFVALEKSMFLTAQQVD